MMIIVHVSLFNTRRDYFDYAWNSTLPPPAFGCRVKVPFRKKNRVGIVVGIATHSVYTLKPVLEVLDEKPLITLDSWSIVQFISQYYHVPLSMVLTLAIPKRFRQGLMLSTRHRRTKSNESLHDTTHHEPKILNEEQRHALHTLTHGLGRFETYLLQGVTGSGKTEVYLQFAAKILEAGDQVLMLVPEIALTPQLLARLRARFQYPIGVIHSGMGDHEKAKTWLDASQVKLLLIMGTRTALFTPMPRLKLIIIDEEHDPSFKQHDGVRFSARDVAIVRARQAGCPIVLGSATPSLETFYHATQQKYHLVKLTQKAENQNPLYVQCIDLRQQSVSNGLTNTALALIKETLARQEQVLIFMNRRGFSPVLWCSGCHWAAFCHYCDAHMTLHQQHRLICHHCGDTRKAPINCPQCHTASLIPMGTGTQRIQETLAIHFPDANMMRIDRDEIKTPEAWDHRLQAIISGEVSLMIGTQMLTKGHHFPYLSLVIVLDVDTGFYHHDFRALERLGQLMTQVAGRAGRAGTRGHLAIQTALPDHPLLQILIQQGYEAFIRALLPLRLQGSWPPYTHLTLIRVQGRHTTLLQQALMAIKHLLIDIDVQLLGPAPAPLAKKSNLYHYQLLIKATHRKKMQQALSYLQNHITPLEKQYKMHCSLDVDPLTLT